MEKTFTIKELERFLEDYKKDHQEVPLTAEGLVQLFKDEINKKR